MGGTEHGASEFCNRQSCPSFDVRKYLRQLRQMLPLVPPVDLAAVKRLHDAHDHKGIVRLIKRLMNIEAVTFRVLWVPDGAATHKDAPAWVELPQEMPFYGSDEFKKMTIKIYFRKSFFRQDYDSAALAVAHELSHIVLESIRHPLRRCEKAVDLTAMILGFSRVYEAACYKEARVGNMIYRNTLGYLSREEAIEANRLLRSEQPPAAAPQATDRNRQRRPITTRTKALALALAVIALAVALPAYKVAALHQELTREQRLLKAHVPQAVTVAITLVDVRLDLTNLTLVYRISAPRSMVYLPALQANERVRLCEAGWNTYAQEYRDQSNDFIGKFTIDSCP